MIVCEACDIVLVRFPFTDLSNSKQRPALIIHPAGYTAGRGDAVVLALTSRPQADDGMAINRWQEAGLPRPTWIKPLIATLAVTMFTGKLGRIESEDWPVVEKTIRLLIAARFIGRA
jgi:mRNA interferase MazF